MEAGIAAGLAFDLGDTPERLVVPALIGLPTLTFAGINGHSSPRASAPTRRPPQPSGSSPRTNTADRLDHAIERSQPVGLGLLALAIAAIFATHARALELRHLERVTLTAAR